MRTVYQKAAQRQRIIKEAKRSKNISATARKHGRNRTFYSVKDANEQLKHYQRFANMAPRQVFNWRSANDRLLDFLLVV